MRVVHVYALTVALIAARGGSTEAPVSTTDAGRFAEPSAPLAETFGPAVTSAPAPSATNVATPELAPTAIETPDAVDRVVVSVGDLRYTSQQLVSDLRIRKHLASLTGLPFQMPYEAFSAINQAINDEMVRQLVDALPRHRCVGS